MCDFCGLPNWTNEDGTCLECGKPAKKEHPVTGSLTPNSIKDIFIEAIKFG